MLRMTWDAEQLISDDWQSDLRPRYGMSHRLGSKTDQIQNLQTDRTNGEWFNHQYLRW